MVGLGGAVDTRDSHAEFAQRDIIRREELLNQLRETVLEADRTLAAFDQQKLLDRFTIQGRDVSALSAILRVDGHFSMHTGQIILLAKMLSKDTTE